MFIQTFGHKAASAFKAGYHFLLGVEHVTAEVANNPVVKKEAELVAGAIGGPTAAGLVDMGFAVLGELSSVLAKGDAAAEAKLKDAGLDQAVIDGVKQLTRDSQGLFKQIGVAIH